MEQQTSILVALAILGTVLGWLLWLLRQQGQSLYKLQSDKESLLQDNARLKATLCQSREEIVERVKLLDHAKVQLSDAFKALSAEALTTNNQSFLLLAKTTLDQLQQTAQNDLAHRQSSIGEMITPVKQALQEVDHKLQALEKERISAYQILHQQVHDLIGLQKELRSETHNLVKALRTPHVRGQWGEMQLKRTVEIAGMLSHCDFLTQSSVEGENGRLRPDMVINLPGQKTIVVDAKAPLSAYLEALEAGSEQLRNECLHEHARQVRQHIRALSQKAYWEQFASAPDFVILFLPGEPFFSAALEKDPTLIEIGVKERVILATPTTLIAMLRAVAYGWRQESIAANTAVISELGREIYKRLQDLGSHLTRLGKNLGIAVESYNQTVGTLERRVLVSARRFQELDTSLAQETVEDLKSIDVLPRPLSAPELYTSP